MINTIRLINTQRRIGLTGGIASGKSTITNYIRTYKKIPILDADNIGRELIKPNTVGYEKILTNFGNQIIDKDSPENAIDRKLLKNIIFKDEKNRKWIQKLLHPLIKQKMITECNKYKNNKIILLVVPLLFEAKFEDICNEIWLVKCPEKQQIQRLAKRDKINEKEASAIIKLQMNYEAKIELSDVILDNSDKTDQWINKIENLI